MASESPARSYAAALATLAIVMGLAGLGYLAFLAFVKGILVPGEFAGYGLAITAVAAGTASFFSPCAFTVLPSYIAFAGGGQAQRARPELGPALVGGLAASFGIVTAVSVLGLAVAVLGTGVGASLSITGDDPSRAAQGFRIGVGAFVIAMGLVHLLDWSHRAPLVGRVASWAVRVQPEGGSLRSLYAYGAGYAVVGIGWTGPFLAAVAAYATATGGFVSAFFGVGLFTATMGVLMLIVSLVVGVTRSTALRGLKGTARPIQRVGSVIMLLVGAGLIYSTVQPDAFRSVFFPG